MSEKVLKQLEQIGIGFETRRIKSFYMKDGKEYCIDPFTGKERAWVKGQFKSLNIK